MHPIIFTFPESLPLIGGAHIYSYGVMLGLAFISGWYLAMHFATQQGLSYKTVTNAFGLAIVCALLGARVAHLISNPETWKFQGFFPALLGSKCEGLVAYGGYIGGVLSVYIYLRVKKVDFWNLCDCSTPTLLLGLGMTRIGCFLAGCCHGQPTDLPWCMSFPAGSQAASVYPGPDGHSLCVHPTQLYESLVGFALFPIAIYFYKRRKFTGQTFLIMIPFYAVARFLLEIIRGDTDRGTVAGLSTSQFIGLALIVFAIGAYLWRRKIAPAPNPPLPKEEIEARLIAEGAIKKKGKTTGGSPKKK